MFKYEQTIIEKFPQVVGGIILADGMSNQPSSEDLQAQYQSEQAKVLDKLGDAPLSELKSISAWRSTFREFGVNPTKTRSAAEALLRRLTKKGDIPSINTLVDVGNLVSIRYGLPVAIFDRRSLKGTLTVQFADGDERYTELGSDEIKHPEKGEVIFADDTDLVFARRWCWRQSLQSAARLDTTQAIITVEAQHDGAQADIEQAQTDLLQLLQQYAGGSYQAKILNGDRPQF